MWPTDSKYNHRHGGWLHSNNMFVFCCRVHKRHDPALSVHAMCD